MCIWRWFCRGVEILGQSSYRKTLSGSGLQPHCRLAFLRGLGCGDLRTAPALIGLSLGVSTPFADPQTFDEICLATYCWDTAAPLVMTLWVTRLPNPSIQIFLFRRPSAIQRRFAPLLSARQPSEKMFGNLSRGSSDTVGRDRSLHDSADELPVQALAVHASLGISRGFRCWQFSPKTVRRLTFRFWCIELPSILVAAAPTRPPLPFPAIWFRLLLRFIGVWACFPRRRIPD